MGRNVYKLTKILMTSSSRQFYDVIKIGQQKNRQFWRVFAEYLKNASTDFYQSFIIFRQLYIDMHEIEILKIGH